MSRTGTAPAATPPSTQESTRASLLGWLADQLPRPLDRVRSVKWKVTVLMLVSGGAGLAYLWTVYRWVPPLPIALVTVLVVVGTAQIVGHGMTRPLRAMTAAATAMARGDWTRRVRATSCDEVGELAGAFNAMADELAAADRARRELIANVSHELRTPIAALQAVLENLVDGVSAADPATLGSALTQTERLGRLVAELLDLSRLDAGVGALRPEPVALAPLLAAVATEADAAARAAGRDVAIAVRIDSAAAVVRADRARLHQIVLNLLDNATRHGPSGSTVRVTAHREDTVFVLDVHDEGPGIDPADRDRVFHRFTRGERAVGGGTGLGLSITRWAVELHGGRIAVLDPADPSGSADPTRPAGPAAMSGCRIRLTLPDQQPGPSTTGSQR